MSVTNLPISGAFPGLQFIPGSPESGGVYHEIREVDGFLYIAYNATFNGTEWQLYDTSAPKLAFAIVQNPDGSTHYYTNPTSGGSRLTSWTTWAGSGNNNIFNAVDYGLVTGSGAASNNVVALQAAIDAVKSAGGGIVIIPAAQYYLNNTIEIDNVNGLIIAGTGGRAELYQQDYVPIFSVTKSDNGSGVRFCDLRLRCLKFTSDPPTPFWAITVGEQGAHVSSQNITCERVYFEDCPGAFIAYDSAVQCGLLDCTIDYNSGSPPTDPQATYIMVALYGSQCFVRGCVVRQNAQYEMGPANCNGLLIGSVSTSYVSDCQISDFTIGIQVGNNAKDAFFANVRVDAWQTAVTITVSKTGQGNHHLWSVLFANCTFFQTNYPDTEANQPGVFIDTGGEHNMYVASILFSNCVVAGFGGAGLQINSGQNVVVTGGQFSSNGQNASSEYLAAGIAITGPTTDVTITGADCTPTYELVMGMSQSHGISVIAGGTALIRGCNLSGYELYSDALYTESGSLPGTPLYVTSCAGYNDQGVEVRNGMPSSAATFYGYTYQYYGPVEFYTTPGEATISEIDVAGLNTHLTSGSFFLAPGEPSKITWSDHIVGSAIYLPLFLMIGK